MKQLCKNRYIWTSHTYAWEPGEDPRRLADDVIKAATVQVIFLRVINFIRRAFWSHRSSKLELRSFFCPGRKLYIYIHKAVISKLESRPKGASHRSILLEDAAWILVEDTAEKVIHLLATFMILFNRNFGCKIFPEFISALHHTILKRCEISKIINKWVVYFLTNRHSSFPQ